MTPVVEFIELRKPEKARHLCELAEQFFQQGRRVLVTVDDANQALTLDQFMWIWKKISFVPHACDNGAVDCLDQPVVITTEEHNSNGAEVLVMGRPCSLEFIAQFHHVIAFVEHYDAQLLAAARERWRSYREAGFAPALRQ